QVCASPPTVSEPESSAATIEFTEAPVAVPTPTSTWTRESTATVRDCTRSRGAAVVVGLEGSSTGRPHHRPPTAAQTFHALDPKRRAITPRGPRACPPETQRW